MITVVVVVRHWCRSCIEHNLIAFVAAEHVSIFIWNGLSFRVKYFTWEAFVVVAWQRRRRRRTVWRHNGALYHRMQMTVGGQLSGSAAPAWLEARVSDSPKLTTDNLIH